MLLLVDGRRSRLERRLSGAVLLEVVADGGVLPVYPSGLICRNSWVRATTKNSQPYAMERPRPAVIRYCAEHTPAG